MSTKEAFFEICKDAQPTLNKHYVSLYCTDRWYGGPEEGGWWGNTDQVLASYECATEGEAEAIAQKVREHAEQLSKEAKEAFGRQCQRECEWLEARGLDDDFLPEVGGEMSYWVSVETNPGSHNYESSRYYE